MFDGLPKHMTPKIDFSVATSKQILSAICSQLVDIRLERNWTQAKLAEEAGVSIKTITNLENGKGISLDTFVRVIMAFNLQADLENLLPDATVRPIERVRKIGKERKRARRVKPISDSTGWMWGDETDSKS